MIPTLLALLWFASVLCGQQSTQQIDNTVWWSVHKTTTLVAGTEKVTVQYAATGINVRVYLHRAEVYCTVICTVTVSKAGTAATTTALSPVAWNKWTGTTDPQLHVTAFSASNVGAGTSIRTFVLAALQTKELDLEGFVLESGSTSTRNFSIGTSSLTGDVSITIKGRER